MVGGWRGVCGVCGVDLCGVFCASSLMKEMEVPCLSQQDLRLFARVEVHTFPNEVVSDASIFSERKNRGF